MILTAYAQVSQPQMIQLCVGMFRTEQPPAPRFFVDKASIA